MKPLWPSHYMPPKKRATAGDVLRYVANAFGCTPAELTGTSRKSDLVRARAAAITILVRRGNGYAGTGRLIKRDHTTILHSMRRYPDYIRQNPSIAVVVERFMLDHA